MSDAQHTEQAEPAGTVSPAHVDALARLLIATWGRVEGPVSVSYVANFADMARAVLGSTDPEVHAALLDALTRHGVLTEDTQHAVVDSTFVTSRCLRTPWRDLTSDEAIAFLRERLIEDQP